MGCSAADVVPLVVANVPSKTRKQCTMAQALHDQSWPADIQGGLSLIGLFEYFQLWDMLLDIHLYPGGRCAYMETEWLG